MGYSVIANRIGYLRTCLRVSAVTLVGGALVGGLARGWPGAFGVAAGVLLVAASYVVSAVIVAWVDAINPQWVMAAGLGTYAIKFILLFGVVGMVARVGWIGMVPTAVGVIAGVIAWTGAQIYWTWHAKILYVDDTTGDAPPLAKS
jgi:hypothetical protein